MNNLVIDWNDFCEGKKDFDKSHFYSLFWEDINPDDLKTIFKHFDQSKELLSRTNDYLFGPAHKDLGSPGINQKLTELALKDIREKLKICKAAGNLNLVELIENSKVRVTHDNNFVEAQKAQKPYTLFVEEIMSCFRKKRLSKEKKAYALYEAFYGLVKNYEMVWYLYAPLVDVDLDLSYYYDFARLGGNYSFFNGEILISHDAAVS